MHLLLRTLSTHDGLMATAPHQRCRRCAEDMESTRGRTCWHPGVLVRRAGTCS